MSGPIPSPINPDDVAAEESAQSIPSAGSRGAGSNADRLRALIAENPLLSADEEQVLLRNLVQSQREALRVLVGLREPWLALLAGHRATGSAVPAATAEDGDDAQAAGRKSRYARRPFLTPEICDGIRTALRSVEGATSDAQRQAAIAAAEPAIFSLIGYPVIRDLYEQVDLAALPGDDAQRLKTAIAACERVRLVLHHRNARLIMREALDLSRRSSASLDDLIQEGALGLLTAIDRYMDGQGIDGRDTRLSTVAKRWIRARMTRWLSNHASTIRLPDHLQKKVSRIGRTLRELAIEQGVTEAEVSDRSVAERAELTLRDVNTLRHLLPKVTSLDAPIQGADGEETSIERTVASPDDSPENLVAAIDGRTLGPAIAASVQSLGLAERMILGWLFDAPSGELQKATLQEFGQSRVDAFKDRVAKIRREAGSNPHSAEVRASVILVNPRPTSS